ncbi:MAG: flagellar basal-body rod protein FlgG [Planctomycetota bacterium]
MLKSLFTAATGMRVQQTNVDVISNNLANVNTSGFKKSQANFEDLIYVTEQRPGFGTTGVGSSGGIQIGSGARLVSTAKVFSQGVLESTQRPMDVAIMGNGFFQVSLPDGSFAFTRDGNLHLDESQNMVTSDGYKLSPAVSLSGGPYDSITINTNGEVLGAQGNTNTSLGQITLTTFMNPAGLESMGNNLFRETNSSGTPTSGLTPGEDGVGKLQSNFLERSNVDVVNELVSLIIAQRAYEVNSKAIKTGDDMLQLANNLSN